MDIKISFNKKKKTLEDTYIELAVERIISSNTNKIIDSHKLKSSLIDIQYNVFGAKVTTYQTFPRHKGMIIKYMHPNILGKYLAKVELFGYNPRNIDNKELRSKLEYLANTNFSKKELDEMGVKLFR